MGLGELKITTGHSVLGLRAFEMLPEWERALYAPEMVDDELSKPWMPEGVANSSEAIGVYCSILDWTYYPELFPYTLLEDGSRRVPHGLADADGNNSYFTGKPHSHEMSRKLLTSMAEKFLTAVSSGDWWEAVKRGGAMGHYIQEPFTPGHSVPNELFHELFPDPDPNRHVFLHSAFDKASGDFESLPARLLGSSLEEIVYRIQIEMDRGVKKARELVAPVLESVYAGKPDSVRYELLSVQSQMASHLTASAWHSIFSLAYARFDESELSALRTLDLTTMDPYYFHANGGYAYLERNCIVLNQRKTPIVFPAELAVDMDKKHSFCLFEHSSAKFYVDGNLYPRFQCSVCIPANAQPEGDVNTFFSVETDDRVNTTTLGDLEYGANTILEFALKPGVIQNVDVDITGAKSLILKVKSHPFENPDTGELYFNIPHVAILAPILSKK